MKLLLTLLSMATLAAAGTITVKDYTDATCTTADTECGVGDVDLTDAGTCPDGKTTEELTKSMTFTVGTCMTAADDPGKVIWEIAALAPAASWKIVCSGGKGVVKLFTDDACATAIASATVIDTAYNALVAGSMGAGVTVDMKIGAAWDSGMSATQCLTLMTFAADKAAMMTGPPVMDEVTADATVAAYSAQKIAAKVTMSPACPAPAPPPAASNAAHAAPLLVLLVGYFA